MLLENIYGTGITHFDCHLQLSNFYSTDPWLMRSASLRQSVIRVDMTEDTTFKKIKDKRF